MTAKYNTEFLRNTNLQDKLPTSMLTSYEFFPSCFRISFQIINTWDNEQQKKIMKTY